MAIMLLLAYIWGLALVHQFTIVWINNAREQTMGRQTMAWGLSYQKELNKDENFKSKPHINT